MAEKKEESNEAPPDIYDEEFATNLQLAKTFIEKLARTGDKSICKKWIRKLIRIKSNDPIVKKNRNAFFKYLLEILSKAVLETEGQSGGIEMKKDDEENYMRQWSKDKRTYIAAKPLPGQGTLVYMAVSKDPSLGWDHPYHR